MRVMILACMVLLAGCAEAPLAEPPKEEAATPYHAQALNATLEEASSLPQRDDWFLLPAIATLEGTLAGYEIPVPIGAAVPTWYDESQKHPVVEFSFLEESTLEAWALLFVDMDAGKVLAIVSGFESESPAGFGASAGTPAGSRQMGTGAEADYIDLPLEEGDRLGVVVAAKGEGVADVGIRFAEADPFAGSTFTRPSEDADEFLSRTSGNAWMAEGKGAGAGVSLDMFYDQESILSPSGTRHVVGAMEVEEVVPDLPAPQPANDMRLRASAQGNAGFTSTLVWSWTGVHAGVLEYDLHARRAQVEGTDVLTPDPVVHSILAAAVGDGEGTSGVDVHLLYAGAPGVFPKLTIVDHLAFDTSLEDLLGVPVEDATYSRSLAMHENLFDLDRLVLDGAVKRVYQGL